jgi:8-oxo-dGTP pyrophosphatase MutT (NUDIX family)
MPDDTATEAPEDDAIRAAGGVLWRERPDGVEIVVIHRSRYGQWALPKGKLEPGESWEDAARREVWEETGIVAEIGDFVGLARYAVDGRPKVVRYWTMRAAGDQHFEPSEEVDQAIWVPMREALQKLPHEEERAVVREVGRLLERS